MFQKQLSIAEIESKVILLKIASGAAAGVILFFSKYYFHNYIYNFRIFRENFEIRSYSHLIFIGFFNFFSGLDHYMETVASGYLT